MLIWFLPQIEKLVLAITSFSEKRGKPKKGGLSGTKLLNTAGTSVTPGLRIAQLTGFNRVFLRKTLKSFENVRDIILQKYNQKKVASVLEVEAALDTYRYQMLQSLYEIQSAGTMGESSRQVFVMVDIVKKTEEVGDYFAKIARRVRTAYKNNVSLKKKDKELLEKQLSTLSDQVILFRKNLKSELIQEQKKRDKKFRLEIQDLFQKMEKRANSGKFKNKSDWLAVMLALDISRNLDMIGGFMDTITELHYSS